MQIKIIGKINNFFLVENSFNNLNPFSYKMIMNITNNKHNLNLIKIIFT